MLSKGILMKTTFDLVNKIPSLGSLPSDTQNVAQSSARSHGICLFFCHYWADLLERKFKSKPSLYAGVSHRPLYSNV